LKIIDKKLIIFDLDGTLIDSVPDLAISVNLMLKELKHTEFDENTIRQWVGNGALTLVKRALSQSVNIDEKLDSKVVDNALKIFLKIYSQNLAVSTITYPNVATTLKALKEKGYTLAIVTNKPFEFVEPLLNKLELNNIFKHILGGDSLKEKKPSPMPLLHVCKEFKVSVEESIMIGDSKNDILSANACNMQSIGVTYGYNYGESIDIYNPTTTIDNFAKLNEIL
jgi:phosphoglycolate phosphatase